MTRGKYKGFIGASRFTTPTRTRLERAVGRSLFGEKSTRMPLRRAVEAAVSELRAQGMNLAKMQAFLAALVEDAGRTCGADRPSLMTREPLWLSVQAEVLDASTQADAEFMLLMPIG